MGKRSAELCFVCLFLLVFISSVSALTGSIGNSRMTLRLEPGQEIEKYILVKNINEVPLEIEIFASGDLEQYVEIKDNNFSLEPGSEKKAYFTIKTAEEGTTETNINIKFTPEEGDGVGLSSVVTVISQTGIEVSEGAYYPEDKKSITGQALVENVKSPVGIAVAITGIMTIILIILLIVLSKKTKKIEQITSAQNSEAEKIVQEVSKIEEIEKEVKKKVKPRKRVKRNE